MSDSAPSPTSPTPPGKPLDAQFARALLAGVMEPTQPAEAWTEGDVLSPEELASSFPQLDILECLGRGGMGVVYKARQKTLNRLVALKLLAPERANDPEFAARFEREARALAALNHPHIVAVYDSGQAGGFYYLLMEFMDGVNLRQLLQSKQLTPREALDIVPPVCAALQCAHDHGIVHRDIKPENLLINKAGVVKIADFGIAKILHHESAMAPEGEPSAQPEPATMPFGTPDYAAPEQALGTADHRADIYSLGVVLYEMLTGERPKEAFEAPSKRVQVDMRIDEIVLRALEKTPERRYATASEFGTQVEQAVVGKADQRVFRTRYALLAMALLIVAALGVVYLRSRSHPEVSHQPPDTTQSNPPVEAPALPLPRQKERLTELAAMIKDRHTRLGLVHVKLEETGTGTQTSSRQTVTTKEPTRLEAWMDLPQSLRRLEFRPLSFLGMNVDTGMAMNFCREETLASDGKHLYLLNSSFTSEESLLNDKDVMGDLQESQMLADIHSWLTAGDDTAHPWKLSEHYEEQTHLLRLTRSKQIANATLPDGSHPWEKVVQEFDLDAQGLLVLEKHGEPGTQAFYKDYQVQQIERTPNGVAYARRFTRTFSQTRGSVVTSAVVTLLEPAKAMPEGWKTPPKPPADPDEAKDGKPVHRDHLDVQVLNADTGEAIPGVKIDYDVNDEKRASTKCNSKGQGRIPLPAKEIVYLNLWVQKAGFAMQRVQWNKRTKAIQIPDTHTIKLMPSASISGTVLNENGEPVANATVSALHSPPSSPRIFSSSWSFENTVKTDTSGRWVMKSVAAKGELDNLYFKLSHDSYAPIPEIGNYKPFPELTGKTGDALRDGSARFVMKKGRQLTGQVMNAQGQPVPHCRISSSRQAWHTDAQGRFTLPFNGPVIWLTFECDGYAPAWKEVRITSDNAGALEPLAVNLLPAKTIHARVLQHNGKPFAALSVSIARWLNPSTRLHFNATTDAEGRFTWTTAPADTVQFNFSSSSAGLYGVPLKASDEEQVVTWKPALQVDGAVVDDATGEPLPSFTFTEGTHNSLGSHWMLDRKHTATNGSFHWETQNFETIAEQRLLFNIEADGYEPLATEPFETRQQVESPKLRLKKRSGTAAPSR